jgi:predicted TIM-barrel fold metal-dependent hydrolase
VKAACDCHVHVFGPPERFRACRPEREAGLERVVIVKASPYGTDNRCMLDAPSRLGMRARGVAVIDESTSLIPMHGLGVRGVRVSTPEVLPPFDEIDDAAALARLRRCARSDALFEKILLDNPARLYDFQEDK